MVEIHGLSACSRLVLKVLFVLWVLAIVVESGDKTKRDVIHRIVLKSGAGRKPRSQKHHHLQSHGKGHGNRESRSHKHGHYRDHDDSNEFDDSKYHSHENSRESRRNRSPEDSRESRERFRETRLKSKDSREKSRESRETSSRELSEESRENSFESSYTNGRSQKERTERQKYHKPHRFSADFDVEETRLQEPTRVRHNVDENWASTVNDVPPPPKINAKKRPKKYRASLVEFTTSFPVKPPPPPQYSAYEPLYPPVPVVPALPPFAPPTLQYNQKTEFSEIQPLAFNQQFPVLEPKPVNQFTNFLPLQSTVSGNRNFSNTYEVNEQEIIDVKPTKSLPTSTGSFRKVSPTSFQKTSSTQSANFDYSTPSNTGIILKEDIKKLPTTRPTKRWIKTKG